MFRRFTFPFLLAAALLWPVSGVLGATPAPPVDKVSPWVLDAVSDGDQTDFLVVLVEQADLSLAYSLPTKQERGRFVRDTLWETAQRSQANLRTWLDARDVPYRSFYIVNMLHIQTGDLALVNALAARSDVARIEANPHIQNTLPQPVAYPLIFSPQVIEWGISKVNADDVWALGYTGQGVVVGAQDTGYDWDHPALVNQYRGWDGATADHDYNWHDAIHSGGGTCGPDSAEPCDDHYHGTHTLGTVLGDDGGTNQIGMAPGARWIGCRNMNQGVGTPATYLECFEFFLAPYPVGGTPAQGDPDKAPDVTNNSWSCPASEGCSWDTLQAAVEAQRAAGIMTVVSAGNEGSGCSSVAEPPGLYDASYSVGATNSSDNIASFSSRGPVTIDGSGRLKPDISAPGVNVRSSFPGGSYGTLQGTSMAAPHVAGAVALLWSAQPALPNQIELTEDILNQAAVPLYSTQCGDPANTVPNNVFGWGRLDVLAAVQEALLLDGIGNLVGTVDDGSAPVVGAEVEIASSPTSKWTTTSVAEGLYNISLFSDTYTVTVTAPGYMSYHTAGVMVTADSTTTLDVTLSVTPTHVISGHVRDAATGLPMLAMVGLPGVTPVPTSTDPATGFYSFTVMAQMGSIYTLRAEAEHYISQERPIILTGNLTENFDLEPFCLLVVDDDGGMDYETYYTDALGRLGYSYNTTTIPPDAEALSHYEGTIWLTGNQGGDTLTTADQTNLASYLDAGGRLFLSGQDIGIDIGTTSFYSDYLHTDYDSDDTNVDTLMGLDFLSGLDVTISGGDGANNQLYPSDVEPVGGGVAVYDYPAPHLYGGVAYAGTYRTVYFSFGYEAINSQADRDAVMSSTLAYLGACSQPEPCELISGADFNHAPLEPLVRETVLFTATVAEGTAVLPITYNWNFGDGITRALQTNTITHTFPFTTTELTYTVSLTVANACPSQQTVERAITVRPFPYAVYLPLVLRND